MALLAGKTLCYWTKPQQPGQEQAGRAVLPPADMDKHKYGSKYLKYLRWTLIHLIRCLHNLNMDKNPLEDKFIKHL